SPPRGPTALPSTTLFRSENERAFPAYDGHQRKYHRHYRPARKRGIGSAQQGPHRQAQLFDQAHAKRQACLQADGRFTRTVDSRSLFRAFRKKQEEPVRSARRTQTGRANPTDSAKLIAARKAVRRTCRFKPQSAPGTSGCMGTLLPSRGELLLVNWCTNPPTPTGKNFRCSRFFPNCSMAVNLHIPTESEIHPVQGVEIGIAEAGIRKKQHKDLTVFRLAEGSAVAGVFTRNRFRAAPVQVCESHLAKAPGIRALVINTGNANAGTGQKGLEATLETCNAAASLLGILPEQVLPFSTGVILEPLPVDR